MGPAEENAGMTSFDSEKATVETDDGWPTSGTQRSMKKGNLVCIECLIRIHIELPGIERNAMAGDPAIGVKRWKNARC
jgi:hypothetical protein